jgi:hypothetical protein
MSYDECPNPRCRSRDGTRGVYECTKCGFQGCWDKYGGGCWPKQSACPSCGASGHWRKVGDIE